MNFSYSEMKALIFLKGIEAGREEIGERLWRLFNWKVSRVLCAASDVRAHSMLCCCPTVSE